MAQIQKKDWYTKTELGSTANGLGASLIGIEDSGGLITAATVEGALAELAQNISTENLWNRSGAGLVPQTAGDSIGLTGARISKGWFTDIESTNMITVGGTSLTDTFVNVSGDTMTGNLTIFKADPTLTLTDTGDNNSATLTRSDTSALMTLKNKVGKVGGTGSVLLDGSSNITFGDVNILDGAAACTIACWYKTTQSTDVGYPFSKGGATPTFWLRKRTSNQLEYMLRLSVTGNVTRQFTNPTPSVTNTNWHHLALTYNGTTVTYYLDGAALSPTDSGSGTVINETSSMMIGDKDTSGVKLPGNVDEAVIWTRALTAGEISDLYNSGSGLYVAAGTNFPSSGTDMGTNLVGLWHIDEGTGTTLNDSAGSNNGSFNAGTPTWAAGLVNSPTIDVTATLIDSEDGTTAGVEGLALFGHANGTTTLRGSTLIFSQAGTQVGTFNSSNNLVLNVGSMIIPDNKSYFLGTDSDAAFEYDTTQTPDSLLCGLPSTSNGIIICEKADMEFDFAHAAQTNPTLFIHSANQNTSQWISFTHNATNGLINTGTGSIILGQNTTIGQGAAGVDYTLTIDGETNDGIITWMEDEDYFQFQDTIKTAGRIFAVTAVSSSPQTVTAAHHVMTASTASAALTFNLPAVVVGTIYIIKDVDFYASVNNVTITPNGSETIDGATGNYTMSTDGGTIILVGITGGWIIL